MKWYNIPMKLSELDPTELCVDLIKKIRIVAQILVCIIETSLYHYKLYLLHHGISDEYKKE